MENAKVCPKKEAYTFEAMKERLDDKEIDLAELTDEEYKLFSGCLADLDKKLSIADSEFLLRNVCRIKEIPMEIKTVLGIVRKSFFCGYLSAMMDYNISGEGEDVNNGRAQDVHTQNHK